MIFAGCDVGSLTAKAVLMTDAGDLLASEVIRTTTSPDKSSYEVLDRVLTKAGYSLSDIVYCVGTGYGRKHIPFANAAESEITCHARGANWSDKSVRTIIDIGGQDAKAIRIDEHGTVMKYVYNDKCASGTGRFLEIMAQAMDIKLEDMGDISLQAKSPVTISNQCVIFAESEIVSLINEDRSIPDIVSGLHQALAKRAAALAKSIGVEKQVTMSGGVAKNEGILSALQHALGTEIIRTKTPQINGALGAALIARELFNANNT